MQMQRSENLVRQLMMNRIMDGCEGGPFEYVNADTNAEYDEAFKRFSEFVQGLDHPLATKVDDMFIEVIAATERKLFEDGMRYGAQLVQQLLFDAKPSQPMSVTERRGEEVPPKQEAKDDPERMVRARLEPMTVESMRYGCGNASRPMRMVPVAGDA